MYIKKIQNHNNQGEGGKEGGKREKVKGEGIRKEEGGKGGKGGKEGRGGKGRMATRGRKE